MISMKLTKENLSDFAVRRRRAGNPLSDEECAQIMTGIFRGVAYLHSEKDIIHRDLKPPNIVVSSYSDLTQCKIIDFGIATQNRKENLRKYGNIGTLIYQPPEQVSNNFNYGKMSDIWALGIITYTLLTGRHPFVKSADSTDDIKDKIMNMKFKEMKFPSTISEQAKHFISKLCAHEQSQRYSATEALQHPWLTRQLSDKPPLTKQEKQQELGELLMIEDKLRKIQSVVFFLSVNKLNHAKKQTRSQQNPFKSLIDIKYLYKLRTQDNITTDGQTSLMKKSSLQRRMTIPKIDVQKTSSLAQRDHERAMKALQIKKQSHTDFKGIQEEQDDDDENTPLNSGNTTHDFIKYSKNMRNKDELSPDVREFLRKHRIHMKSKKSVGGDDVSQRSDKSSKRSHKNNTQNNFNQPRKTTTINENSGQLLMVPFDKKRKKTFSSNSPNNMYNHNVSQDRSYSLSPSSPMELRMNVSGNFSDFMSSDEGDNGGSSKNGDEKIGSSPQLVKNQKMTKASTTTAQQQKKTFSVSQGLNKLPEIEENKSIQAKNSQPKDILSKIKNQRVEVKDIKTSTKYINMSSNFQQYQFQEIKSVSISHTNTTSQKRRMSKPPSIQDTLESQKPGSLIQMMHEQIKDEEEKKRAFGKSQVKQKAFKPGINNHSNNQNHLENINNYQPRASSSHGHYKGTDLLQSQNMLTQNFNSIMQGFHQQQNAGGVVNIEFLPISNNNNNNKLNPNSINSNNNYHSNPNKIMMVPSPQRAQINMFKRMQ